LEEWLGTLQPTWISAGPTVHLAILEKLTSSSHRVGHNLRLVISGGAPLPDHVRVGLHDALHVPVLEHYGATEAAQISANLPPPGPAKTGTVGIPDLDTVMVVGDDGRRLGPGERGEIMISGPTLMSGYLDAPELNKTAFVGGWFRTGDIGSVDGDGFLSLHGRLKEVINRGGEKIAPTEIDVALLAHPDVAEAAAFAVRHPRLGEDVGAAVVLRPGATVTADELRQFLSTQLAWFKVPRRVTIVKHLPKGSTGKVQRRKLSESYR
jgi:acyl-CoA synthetase (AMP-forming)/AMP-acid ligase II